MILKKSFFSLLAGSFMGLQALAAQAEEVAIPQRLAGYQAQTIAQAEEALPGGGVFPPNPRGVALLPDHRTIVVVHDDKKGSISFLEVDGLKLLKGSIVSTALRSLGPVISSKEGVVLFARNEPTEGFVYRLNVQKRTWDSLEAMGRFAHGGLAFGADGAVYMTQSGETGALFKFVPKKGVGFSEGDLFALDSKNRDWVKIEDPSQASSEAQRKGLNTFKSLQGVSVGPEEYVYLAEQGDDASFGRILRINPRSLQVAVHLLGEGPNFAKPSSLFWDSFMNLWAAEGKSQETLERLGPNKLLSILPSGAKVRIFSEVSDGQPYGIAMSYDSRTLYVARQTLSGGDLVAFQGDFRIERLFTAETIQ